MKVEFPHLAIYSFAEESETRHCCMNAETQELLGPDFVGIADAEEFAAQLMWAMHELSYGLNMLRSSIGEAGGRKVEFAIQATAEEWQKHPKEVRSASRRMLMDGLKAEHKFEFDCMVRKYYEIS